MSVALSQKIVLRRHRHRYYAYFGWLITLLFIVVAVLAPWLWTVDPVNMDPVNRLQSVSLSAWLGTDAFGRDVYSRVVYGLRTSLVVAAGVVVLSLAAGTLLGLVAGYVNKLDSLIMRIMDGLMAIPGLILAIALVSIGNAGIGTVIVAITIPEIPRLARLVRSITLSVKTQPYIDAAILSANKLPRLLFRHILPAAIGPLSVAASYAACHAIMIEAMLSFLGAGLPSEIPSIGNTIAEGRRFLQIHPGLTLIPGAILTLIILGIYAVGENLRQRFDPRASWFK